MIVKALLVVLAISLAALGWSRFQIVVLEKENQKVTIERDAALDSVATLEQTLAFQATQIAQTEAKMAALSEEYAKARAQVEYTRNLFADHDFQNLMEKKPGLITNRMQKATDAVFTDLNTLTQ